MDQNSEIAKIAYELYLQRGGAPGDPAMDWVVAEKIFAERQVTRKVETSVAVEEPFDELPSETIETAAPAPVKRNKRPVQEKPVEAAPKVIARKAKAAEPVAEVITKKTAAKKTRKS